jgi:hypothetical protein
MGRRFLNQNRPLNINRPERMQVSASERRKGGRSWLPSRRKNLKRRCAIRYKDDPKNFPGATEKDGVCVGDHVPESILAEAARKLGELRDAIADHTHLVLRDTVRMHDIGLITCGERVFYNKRAERAEELLRRIEKDSLATPTLKHEICNFFNPGRCSVCGSTRIRLKDCKGWGACTFIGCSIHLWNSGLSKKKTPHDGASFFGKKVVERRDYLCRERWFLNGTQH